MAAAFCCEDWSLNSVDGYGEASPFNVVNDVVLPVVVVFFFCMNAGLVWACWRWFQYLLVIDMLQTDSVAEHDGSISTWGWQCPLVCWNSPAILSASMFSCARSGRSSSSSSLS